MTAISLAQAAVLTRPGRALPLGSMLTDFQEATADASSLRRIMSPRRRKNLPAGSLISSSAEAPAIRDSVASEQLSPCGRENLLLGVTVLSALRDGAGR